MDESTINEIGEAPLLHMTHTIRKLYRGESTEFYTAKMGEEGQENGLTAALSFLHSRGQHGCSCLGKLRVGLLDLRHKYIVRFQCGRGCGCGPKLHGSLV
jgi:hypothetical protein